MFHNGSIKDNLNYKTLCPLKQKEQLARISYQNNWNIYILPETGELEMEEWFSIREALQGVGWNSRVCWHWEIYKLVFLLHNIKPVWMEVNITNDPENFGKVFIKVFRSNLKIILVDSSRGYQTGYMNYNFEHYNNLFGQGEIGFPSPQPSIHVAHSISFGHYYIWSSYPSPKTAKIDYSALLNFDPPSAFLFSFSLVGAVVFMKVFTLLNSKLGLDTVSEEPVNIPTRYFGQQSPHSIN